MPHSRNSSKIEYKNRKTGKIDAPKLGLCIWCLTPRVKFMMFYATFNNISVISWRSIILVVAAHNRNMISL
jgi:hypothetical protein